MRTRRTLLMKIIKYMLYGTPKSIVRISEEQTIDIIGFSLRNKAIKAVKIRYTKRTRETRYSRLWVTDSTVSDWVIKAEVKHNDGYHYHGEYRFRGADEETMAKAIVKLSVEDSILKKSLEFPHSKSGN